MAKIKEIQNAFLTTKIKNDIEIERATYKNIDRIHNKDIEEIHTNLMRVFAVKSEADCSYFNPQFFRDLVYKKREEKKTNLQKKTEPKEPKKT